MISIYRFLLAISASVFSLSGLSQGLQVGDPSVNAILLPGNPTSLDVIRLSMKDTSCSVIDRVYSEAPYSISMVGNAIELVWRGAVAEVAGLCPVRPREEFEIGRLPAGNYTISLIFEPTLPRRTTIASNIPFTVTDARTAKTAPFVRLDYSGHWWDPNDSGWGLFVWHDAKDNVLAAWFTYGADGKPIWWVFQPRWQTATATQLAALVQTSRAPGPNSPPPNPTTSTQVGTVSLDFTRTGSDLGETGKITYQIGNGPTLTRNLVRFKP